MRKSVIWLLALAVSATALVAIALTSSAKARATRSAHPKAHAHRILYPSFAPAFQPRPVVSAGSGDVCPGSGRSFECKIWPPPFDQDPDRKISGSDGGG